MEDPNKKASNKRAVLALGALGLVLVILFGSCIVMNRSASRDLAKEMTALRQEMAERSENTGKTAVPDGAVRTGKTFDWQIVGSTTIGRTVYLEPAAYNDYCFFADTFYRVKDTLMEGRSVQVFFYDDLASTPKKLNRSATAHLRAIYAYSTSNGSETFDWVVPNENPAGPPHHKRAPIPGRCP